MTKFECVIEYILQLCAIFWIGLGLIIFDNKRIYNIALETRKRPKVKIDKRKFNKLMKRITK